MTNEEMEGKIKNLLAEKSKMTKIINDLKNEIELLKSKETQVPQDLRVDTLRIGDKMIFASKTSTGETGGIWIKREDNRWYPVNIK